jgi:hypothetical protein
LARALRPLAEAAFNQAACRVSAETRAAIEDAVRIGIAAAEAAGLNGLIKREGSALMDHAVIVAQTFLNEHGLPRINVGVIAAAIRAGLAEQLPVNSRALPSLNVPDGWGASTVEIETL